jgi:hypothetical protein
MKLLAVVFAVSAVLWAGQGATAGAQGRAAAGRAAAALGLLALVTALPLGLTALLVAPPEQLDQVVAMHLAASRAMPLGLAANVEALRAFLEWDPALVGMAAVGAVGVLAARPAATAVLLAWLASSAAFLVLYHPLLTHQFVIVLPPLALLAGASAAGLCTPDRQLRGAATLVAVLALVAYAVLAPRTLARDGGLFFPTPPTPRAQLAAFVAAHTAPGEMIVADDLFVAVEAGRLVPPPLSDPSSVRITAGYLSAAQAIAATERYHVRLVALWRGVYSGRLPDYVAWLEGHGYRPLAGAPPGATVLARQRA